MRRTRTRPAGLVLRVTAIVPDTPEPPARPDVVPPEARHCLADWIAGLRHRITALSDEVHRVLHAYKDTPALEQLVAQERIHMVWCAFDRAVNEAELLIPQPADIELPDLVAAVKGGA